jgi:tripartite-type tricarboxylate transporter receptor subunit TctC
MRTFVRQAAATRLQLVHRGSNDRRLVTQHPRRRILSFAVGVAALPAARRGAWAQTYPTRPVRVIVPAPPADMLDILARLMGQWLSARLGQPFIIVNRPGAVTNIGTEAAVRAPADGYTLLMIGPPAAINATLYDKLNFNVLRDLAPVASIARAPNVLEVNLSVPVKTVPELIAYAKANPGKLNLGSGAVGSSLHLSGELFKIMTGVNMFNVAYGGSVAALTGLLGGEVQVYFDNLPASIEYIKAGKVRALAVTASMRSEALPDLPTVGEFVPGYETSPWWGIVAPKATAGSIIDTLNQEINAALADATIKARLAPLGATVFPGSPAEFGMHIANETAKWAKVIQAANIKPE